MKISRILPVVAIIVLAIAVTSASATHFTIDTMVNVQNLSGEEASIDLYFYNMDGSIEATVSDTIPANNDKLYFPLGVGDGFNGSMIVTSGQNIRAVANLYGSVGGIGAASYTGFQSGDTEVLVPLLMKNNGGFSTWFHVQNTGVTTATVDVSYTDGTSVTGTEIPVGSSALFDQGLETHSQAFFAGTITSDEPVAVTVVEEEDAGNVMFAYNGFLSNSADVGTGLVIPLVNSNNSGYVTGVQIQNAGTTDTQITLSYTPGIYGGTACTETHTLSPDEMEVFALFPFAGVDPSGIYPDPGTTSDCDEKHAGNQIFVGSATLTQNSNSQNLVAITNQLLTTGGVQINGEAYGGFNPAGGVNSFVMPLVLDRYGANDYWTSVNLTRVGGTTAFTVSCEFSDNAYTYTSESLAVDGDATSGLFYNQLDPGGGGGGYVGSAVCTASEADGRVIAVVNQLGATGAGDLLLVYEGLSSE